ncbi:MAG: phenylalanine--tRNA ligase subunit alpha [Clostridia bacterium]
MEKKLDELLRQARKAVENAGTWKEIEDVRVRFLGKKGELTMILRDMGGLNPLERPAIGKMANEVRETIQVLVEEGLSSMQARQAAEDLKKQSVDVTMPGIRKHLGRKHPLTQVIEEMERVFLGLGYQIAEGPEVEYSTYNFDALNTPPGHPARDEQDTFYFSPDILLRTQTSPVQVRVMKQQPPPIKIICPGRVYRADEVDATHSPIFHQIEALVVDKGVSMGDLTGTLRLFAKSLFGEKTEIRLRPHHFPFTEPSAEVDVSCWGCGGTGCRICKGEGWVEILGAGMVHPNVLSECGINPEVYTGFAFGLGVERVAMARFGISDLRLLFENDIRFLKQF